MPPKPLEKKRLNARNGTHDAGGRLIPSSKDTAALTPASSPPPPPEDLREGGAGVALWNRTWAAASSWVSPETDRSALERACRLADLEKILFEEALLDPHKRGLTRRFVEISNELGRALSALGFDPSARSRLGVAEVKAKTKLEEMKLKREAAGKGSNA